jgi:hypothetical protein
LSAHWPKRCFSAEIELRGRNHRAGTPLKPLLYRNTLSKAKFSPPLHESEPRGYGYEIDSHFVHFYGRDSGLWVISSGLTVTQGKIGVLTDWIATTFGATELATSAREVGHTTAGVWRPGIFRYEDIRDGLSSTDSDRHEALQSIRLLLDRLDELFLYIEPSAASLRTYSHKTRELLILACTEVENLWTRYMHDAKAAPINGRGYTTNDYVKLVNKLYLREFQITLKAFPSVQPSRPSDGWTADQPTRSITWYDGYNQTKHDRRTHFNKATLKNCVDAVAANLAMFSARFSPYPLYNEGGTVSALFKQLFEIELKDPSPETFYVPLVKFPDKPNLNFIVIDSAQQKLVQPWTVHPFSI